MTEDDILFNFNAISKIMKHYIYFFYQRHVNDIPHPLLKFNEKNIEIFEKSVQEQAIKITDKMRASCTPDRHKIIAVCLKSFISANIFYFDRKQYDMTLESSPCYDGTLSLYTIYPNEMFCIEIIKIILDEYSTYKKIDDYHLLFANHIVGLDHTVHNYIIDLFKLILGYEKRSLDFVVQELAHIIFFIEMGYEVSVKGLAHMYYQLDNS